ncbi:uncharacterized protein LOC115231098 [Octopus sinensis]|uniref:Uncharacterized protein LOC115231098 n=1 Tax=Octopus sinensis TaxID=2607531 RepID=A0A6P7U6C9_9MOLL|nr:uncharacterized protein LOC115231098 [Octopus sinensis]
MPRRENLSEDQLSKRLLELDEEWEEYSSDSLYCSEEDDESDCVLDRLGVYKSNHQNVTQLSSKEDGSPIFNKIMSRGRFQQLLQVLHFDDASARRKMRIDDELEHIREVFEMWNQNLQDRYVPRSCMTIAEQLASFRGHCPFLVYIPSKPGKYATVKNLMAGKCKSTMEKSQ